MRARVKVILQVVGGKVHVGHVCFVRTSTARAQQSKNREVKVELAWTKMESSAGHHELDNGQVLSPPGQPLKGREKRKWCGRMREMEV